MTQKATIKFALTYEKNDQIEKCQKKYLSLKIRENFSKKNINIFPKKNKIFENSPNY